MWNFNKSARQQPKGHWSRVIDIEYQDPPWIDSDYSWKEQNMVNKSYCQKMKASDDSKMMI